MRRRDALEVDFLDLRDVALPLCTGEPAQSEAERAAVNEARQWVTNIEAMLIASPVYNYSLSAALKNFIEWTGKAWQDKPVGFCCAAGGRSSYMAVMGLANALMLDFRCWVVPRFIYSSAEQVDPETGRLLDDQITGRIEMLCEDLIRIADALTTSPSI